jgi:hypothetical protein
LYKSFGICRRIVLLNVVLLFGGMTLATTAFAQTSNSTSGKLPPPPTIDQNVNQNDTLSTVRYDNKYDIYGGVGFSHFKAGPNLAQGANLGGFDVRGTRWLTGRLGATASIRGYYGTQGVNPNPYNVSGPFIFEHLFLGGATYRLAAREHAALSVHALAGGAYGVFDHALGTAPVSGARVQARDVGLYNSGLSFASAVGGSLDLNRSPKLALRISPEWILTRYGGYGAPSSVPSESLTVNQSEFGISVGIIYRLGLGKGPRFH